MSVRAARGLQAFVFLLFSLIGSSLTGPALAAGEARSVVTTAEQRLFRLRSARRAEFLARSMQDRLPRRSFVPRLHLQHQGEMVLPQIRLQPAEAVLGRGRRQGRQSDRRARYRRTGRAFLLPVLDGRRGPYLSREPDRRQSQASGGRPRLAHRCRRAGDADGRRALGHAELHVGDHHLAGRRRAVDGPRQGLSGHPASRWRRRRRVPAQRLVGGLERLSALAHRQCARRGAARDCARARPSRLFTAGAAGLSGKPGAGKLGRDQGRVRRPQGAQGLPHRRSHDRFRQRRAARLRAVLRRPGQVGRRLCAVRHRRRRSAQGGRTPAASRSASRAWSTAAPTTSPSAKACRQRSARSCGSPGRARHLHSGSRAFGPLHRRQLRAAGDRPPRHSGRDRQS